jgi:hypothetical protein
LLCYLLKARVQTKMLSYPEIDLWMYRSNLFHNSRNTVNQDTCIEIIGNDQYMTHRIVETALKTLGNRRMRYT